jgi:hypothetical protein
VFHEENRFYSPNYFSPFWMQRVTIPSLPANTDDYEFASTQCDAVRLAGILYPGFICNQHCTAYNDAAHWDTTCHGHSFSNLYANHTANYHA